MFIDEGVMSAIRNIWNQLSRETQDLFWINPSWILLGLKR
jgi:hypothetical protein